MNRQEAEEKQNTELQELADRNLHKLPAGHYRIDFDAQIKAAASNKSGAEMMTEIIGDLRRHNYGIAEHHIAVLIARLEHEEQERRKAKARPEEIELDAFEQTIQGFIANLEKQTPDMPHYNYFVGERCAYRYALEIYKETRR